MMAKLINLRRGAVDEYGELCRQVAAFKPVLDRQKALEREIASWYDEQAPEEAYEVEGTVYTVQISARKRERRITDLPALFKHLGKLEFVRWCTFPLSAIDKLIDKDLQSEFLTEERTGSRTVKAVAKAPLKRAA
jgi:hypothetical protein